MMNSLCLEIQKIIHAVEDIAIFFMLLIIFYILSNSFIHNTSVWDINCIVLPISTIQTMQVKNPK